MGDDHAEEERLAVIAKYDKGREEGAQIDDWEDPAFEIYHVTDRYGFIHDQVLPKLKPDEVKRINTETERVEKWLKMTSPSKWPKFKNSEKLRQRIYKGIPDKMRIRAWKLLLDLDVIKKQQEGKYREMYELARKYSQDVRQIDLDVNRTYRDTRMFRERYGKEQKALFNILCAYSIYNSEVGYCQGMSQVAALLLMYMEEEDAFWALSELMTNTKYGMHGFFIAGFPKLVRFQAHHDKVLKIMLPRLKKHFDKHGVDSGLYTLKWFFQCFLDRVPFELSLRLWDIFLLDGDRVLICGAYSILRMHQKQLLARKNMDDILGYIQSVIPNNFGVDLDKAIVNYQQYYEELRGRKLDTGGEPGDDELPKKPFGVIDIKPATIKRQSPLEKVNKEVAQQKEEFINSSSFDEPDEEETELPNAEKRSISHVSTAPSVASSSFADSPNKLSTAEEFQMSDLPPTVAVIAPKSPTSTSTSKLHIGNDHDHFDQSSLTTQTKMNGLNHNSPVRKTSPSPPPPPPRSPQPTALRYSPSTNNTKKQVYPETPERKASPVPSFSTHYNSPTIAVSSPEMIQDQQIPNYSKVNKRIPPPVMPRKPLTGSISQNAYENHDSSISSSRNEFGFGVTNISKTSNSETVRIHVPYTSSSHNNNNNSSSVVPSPINYSSHVSTSTAQSVSTSSSSSSPVNPRNSFDISKNDPNRIKIDVTSHSTLIQ